MIFNYESVETFLSDELRRRVQLNPRYSLRAFARTLGMSPGALSEILHGKRDLSLSAVSGVAKAFGLNSEESLYLLQLVQKTKALKNKSLGQIAQESKTRDQHRLSQDLFTLVSEWYHFAILNLLDCDFFEWKAPWIARRLNISRIQAQMAMELLVRLGFVVQRAGKFVSKHEDVQFDSEIPSSAVRGYHRQIFEQALQALENQPLIDRDFSGCGFAVDPARVPAIKKEIAKFQDRVLAKYTKGKKSEVYFLEMALFKLTQGSKE